MPTSRSLPLFQALSVHPWIYVKEGFLHNLLPLLAREQLCLGPQGQFGQAGLAPVSSTLWVTVDSSDLPEPLQSEQPDSHACCSDVLRWPSSGVDGHLCDVFLPLYSLPRQQCLCSVTYGVEYPFGQFRVAALVLFPPAPCALTPPQRKASVGS